MRITLLVVSFVVGLGAWIVLARALGRATLRQLEASDAERSRLEGASTRDDVRPPTE